MQNCATVFDNLIEIQDLLKNSMENMQENESDKRSWLSNYKNVHDELDLVQEKLMKIDSSLFER